MPQKRDITKYLFWIVVFLWLIYGTIVAVVIGGNQDWATGRHTEQLELLKGDRDDAFKQGTGVLRDYWGEVTNEGVALPDVELHIHHRESMENEQLRDAMDTHGEREPVILYITRHPVEVFGFLTILGFILSVFFGWVDSRHKMLRQRK